MKIVSFYTENTPYEQEVEKLIESLEKHNLDYRIYPVQSTGNHVDNVNKKPEIIFNALSEYPDTNIIWMDADNVLLSYPTEFSYLDSGIVPDDFASVILFGRPSRNQLVGDWKLAANVMFFRNNGIMRQVCWEWMDSCKGSAHSDHAHLYNVLLKYRDNVSVYCLPYEYFKEFPLGNGCRQVIQHNTVSRNVFGKIWDI